MRERTSRVSFRHDSQKRKKQEESRRRRYTETDTYLFYFRFERLSTFPFFLWPRERLNATRAAPFIRETSRAIQAPFQLEIETRSFGISMYVVRFFDPSSTSTFSFLRTASRPRPRSPHANARRRNFLQACSFVQEFSRKREGKASSFWTFDHIQGQRVSD